MKPQFQRILDLVKRTGDRMVVTDRNGDNAYVVMVISQYEDLLDHSEARLSDFSNYSVSDEPIGDLTVDGEDDGEDEDTESVADSSIRHEEEIPEDLQKAVEHDLAIIESWEKARAQEEAQKSSKKPDSGPNEEQFYLEPVE